MSAPMKINGAELLLSEKHSPNSTSKKKPSKGNLKLIYIQCCEYAEIAVFV
jgi:hypothetical protein